MTEAAEEIRAAADPEANIIFGTSFNERLGDEVMITVIATGFDGGRKRRAATTPRRRADVRHVDRRSARRASATSSRSSSASATESADGGSRSPPADERGGRSRDGPAAIERSVGEPVPVKRAAAYDADDLEIPSFLRRK